MLPIHIPAYSASKATTLLSFAAVCCVLCTVLVVDGADLEETHHWQRLPFSD